MSEWITGKTPPPDQKPDKCIHGFTKCCTEKPYTTPAKPDTTLVKEISNQLWQFHNDRLADPTITEMKPYIQPILDTIAKKLPELEKLKKGDPHLESKVSYNQAILEVRAIIEGK